MNDLDPNFLLPLWQALVAYFRRYHPLIQGDQRVYARGSREARP